MITSDTPLHTILQRCSQRIAWDDTVLVLLGDGMNRDCFKARVLSSTYRPDDIGKTTNDYSRDQWDGTGEQWSPENETLSETAERILQLPDEEIIKLVESSAREIGTNPQLPQLTDDQLRLLL